MSEGTDKRARFGLEEVDVTEELHMEENESTSIVGRLAPSPSGRMHLGNIFAYLMAWLAARSAGGKLVLRIENIDPRNSRRDLALALIDLLVHVVGYDQVAGLV